MQEERERESEESLSQEEPEHEDLENSQLIHVAKIEKNMFLGLPWQSSG